MRSLAPVRRAAAEAGALAKVGRGRSGSSERDPGARALVRASAFSVLASLFALGIVPSLSRAGEAHVVAARARCDAARVCRFEVTVRHADEGWDHYADRWEVLAPDGRVLATRVLLHPHVGEQPFTRTLAGVTIPPGVERVHLRAHDLVHGFGGRELDLPIRAPGESAAPGRKPPAPR